MTDTNVEPSLEARCWDAAVARYKLLDSQMRVELSGHMPHEYVRPAADAAVGLVRREVESTYAALLEANALRDEARDLVYKLKSALELATIDPDVLAACGVDMDAVDGWLASGTA